MDDQVLRSLVKWPNVPECFGWLALDRRGQWRMRDEFAQKNHLSGQVIVHRALNEFITRNYACDLVGNYFFQNGPQRVFVTLDCTPWIVRITPTQQGSLFLTQCQTPLDLVPHSVTSREIFTLLGLFIKPLMKIIQNSLLLIKSIKVWQYCMITI